MAKRTQTKSHSFHPNYKTVGNVCFMCASELLTQANRTPLWQLSLLMEDLQQVFWNHGHSFKQMAISETRTWLAQFVQSLLSSGLVSVDSIQDKTLKVIEAMVQVDACEKNMKKTVAKWITVNTNKVDCSVILDIVSLLLAGYAPADYISQYGEFAVTNIVKGLREDSAKANALKCMSLLVNTFAVNDVHGPVLLAELLCIVEKDSKHQQQAGELMLSLTKGNLPKSVDWLTNIKRVENSIKAILVSKNTQTAVHICEIISLVLSTASCTSLQQSLLKAEFFDILCSSLSTQDRIYVCSALHTIHQICLSSKPTIELPAKYYVECLLRSCQQFVGVESSDILTSALESISLLLSCEQLEMSRAMEALTLDVIRSTISELRITDQALLISIQLLCQILKRKLFGTGCTAALITLIHQLSQKLSVLTLVKVEEAYVQKVFLGFTELLQQSLLYSSCCEITEQSDLCRAVIAAVDGTLLRLLEHMLRLPGCLPEVIQHVFALLTAVGETRTADVERFLDKFVGSGGIALCIELKHWDKPDETFNVTSFLALLVNRLRGEETDDANVTSQLLISLPDDLPSIVLEIFTPTSVVSLSTAITVLYAIAVSDPRSTSDIGHRLITTASGRYDAELVRALHVYQQIRLARLLAKCWFTVCTNGGSLMQIESLDKCLMSSDMRQGLPSFLIDNIDQMLKASTMVLPADYHLLLWIAMLECSDSLLAKQMLMRCCEKCCDCSECMLFTNCITHHISLLDTFMGLVMNQSIELSKAMLVVETVKYVAEKRPVKSMAAIYDVMEVHLCDLIVSICNSATDCDVVVPLKSLVLVLQSGSKSVISSSLSKLLHKVLECLPLWTEDSSAMKIFGNFIVTMLYYSLTAQDYSVTQLVVHNDSLRDYLTCCVMGDDESSVLLAVNILSAAYACVTNFNITLTRAYEVPAACLLDALDGTNVLLKVVFLQLWYTHMKYSLLSDAPFLLWMSFDRASRYDFEEIQFQAMYFCVQQQLSSHVPIVKNTALKVVPALQKYVEKYLPTLGKYVKSQAWNDVVLVNAIPCKETNERTLTDRQTVSPFVNFQGITLLLITETELLQ